MHFDDLILLFFVVLSPAFIGRIRIPTLPGVTLVFTAAGLVRTIGRLVLVINTVYMRFETTRTAIKVHRMSMNETAF